MPTYTVKYNSYRLVFNRFLQPFSYLTPEDGCVC